MVFQKISNREKKYEGSGVQILRENKLEIYLRKQFSKILYKYLKVHLPHYSHNKLCITGGSLLFVMGIMPDTLSDLSNNRKYNDYLRKNFEKALYLFPSLENHTTISLQKYTTLMQG